jgi:hypothetical protein
VAVLHRPAWWLLAGMAGSMAASLFAGDGVTAYAIVAGGTLLHAAHAWRFSRTGAAALVVAAVVTAAAPSPSGRRARRPFLLSAAPSRCAPALPVAWRRRQSLRPRAGRTHAADKHIALGSCTCATSITIRRGRVRAVARHHGATACLLAALMTGAARFGASIAARRRCTAAC